MSERQTTGEFINYRIGERSGKTYNQIQEMAKEIVRLEKENKEWFDIADNILRATNKYGEISIGEVAKYISKLQKENENYKKLILDIKEKLNNIQFEVEQAWRKIEKLENKDE